VNGCTAWRADRDANEDRVWTEQCEMSWLQDSAPWPTFHRAQPALRLVLERRRVRPTWRSQAHQGIGVHCRQAGVQAAFPSSL